ncbi:protein FAR-RED IMPAIRED RESPONSE 1-like [Vigna radiata var. radiata]|uniref:Protein FAR-RED IMPAIRED RESPONSE 1-like n=1 Tax=Vigna radiata var. radiata TaxID=3916 RepID=A0A1S3U0P3_VIGRR|nr:protein FAR-RED IMPAIRED RESPONSE 1-like [Vigna radiata var. radiata]
MATCPPNVNVVAEINEEINTDYDSYLELVPTSNMCFDTMQEAKKFYSDYGEGKYVSNIRLEVKTLPSQTNQCPAGISIARKVDKWFVRTVVLDHSHELCPQTSNLIHGNRQLNMHAKHTLKVNDDASVRINKSFLSRVSEAGGYENMQFVERDARNFIGQHRRSLCKEDARSRAACEEFGDVVSFDTTYLTNKYDMPFAPFVGVNHHGQSILLGCGLLSSEDTSSFIWLFKCWLRCMGNKAPDNIVTNQCKAKANAIEEVFSNTKHRWFLWHIMKKIPEKFQGYKNYVGIKCDIKVVVNESANSMDFDIGWKRLLTTHGLENNE